MEIDSKKFLKIMKTNFGLELVETSLGQGVKMDPYNAFIYSLITGSGYLDNPLFPFTPKGLTKLFYNAFDYKFVTGLFDNLNLKNTPYNLSLAKEYLFHGAKIIIPVEFNSEAELQTKLIKFCKDNKNCTNYIIQRIESSKKGNGMEPFMEYLTCEYFRKKNYLVENQIPLSHKQGSPDFGGYMLKEILSKENGLSNIYLIELAMLRIRKSLTKKPAKIDQNLLIVGEAKTSTTSMASQLNKYLNTKLFDKGFEIHPNKKYPSENTFGLFTLNENLAFNVIEGPLIKHIDLEKRRDYESWLVNYSKYYLLANLTADEFNEFYESKNQNKISSKEDIIRFVNSLSVSEIIKYLNKFL